MFFDHDEEIYLEPGQGVWVPVFADTDIKKEKGTSLCVQQLRCAESERQSLSVAPVADDIGDAGGIIFMTNSGCVDLTIIPEQRLACIIEGGIQRRRCTSTGSQDTDIWPLTRRSDKRRSCQRPSTAGSRDCRCGQPLPVKQAGG